jgi:hypothetical protein
MVQQIVKRRRRDKQSLCLPDRLLRLAHKAERLASQMSPGERRESLMRKAQTAKATAALDVSLRPRNRQPL